MLKRNSTSGTTGSDGVEGEVKKRRVDPPSQLTGAKVTENRSGEEDELKAVEDRAGLAACNGEEEMNKMGICLGMEEEKAEFVKGKVELEKKIAQLKSDLIKEGKRLDSVKAAQEELKGMHLITKELENELAKEKDASASLLSSQAEALPAVRYRAEAHSPNNEVSMLTVYVMRKIPMALCLPLLSPYLQPFGPKDHGVNFAVAGSTAMDSPFFAARDIHVPQSNTPLSLQLKWFRNHLNELCQTHKDCAKRLQRALVFVGEIGGNDYNYAFFQGKPVEEIRTYVPHVVRSITDAVEDVIHEGAIRVVVPGNFPVGCIPIYLTSFPSSDPNAYDDMKCLKDLNKFALFHNNNLQRALENLRQKYHVVILYADYYTTFQSVLCRAPYLGFDQGSLNKACCGIGGQYNYDGSRMCGHAGVPVCSNPKQHIHWDGVHLTQEAYRQMSEWLLGEILSNIKCVW
ncbi:hypothetical protein GIB67_033005 [Kingdonia uniflora]|uniref:Uncharacterized protein n=1 Tax=Kingdonia uniflora TaxID=39325 RepID=A0A7J7MYB4_9MAGN|nr:hypothetical protein GIB67_033005 [Kingdonia uniflora]